VLEMRLPHAGHRIMILAILAARLPCTNRSG
jgi:hypothetical protein